MSEKELSKGIRVPVPANTMRRLRVNAQSLHPAPVLSFHYDASITYLSDYPEAAAQRGIGLPTPIFQKDRSFHGGPIILSGTRFQKGLGLAANTVIVYQLNGSFQTFAAAFGVAEDARVSDISKPSVFFTVHVDGRCRFTSGPTYLETPVHQIEIDVRQAQTLVLRMSGNWDDNGNLENDFGNLGDARLIGRMTSKPVLPTQGR